MPAARSLPLAALADAQLTIALVPPVALAIVAAAAARNRPFAFLAMAVSIADVAARDARANTLTLLHSAPRLREHFTAWKAMSASIVALLFVITFPSPATFVGAFLVVAAAVALRNPKAFLLLFLSFWYIVINDKGATPALDFAGFYGRSTPTIVVAYAMLGAALLAAAAIADAIRCR
jgi:thiosulfate reductase cytochrome b subunit